jgi:L-histidine N-alpha-methyltransferase
MRAQAAPRADATMVAEVRAGLHAVQKKLPSKYLYDERGSALLAEIRARPEYYLDRAERAILAGWGATLIRESGTRTVVHLEAAGAANAELLRSAARAEGAAYLGVAPAVITDGTGPLPLPDDLRGPRLVALLGGAIGGFHSAAAVKLLRRIRAAMSPGDRLLLGADLRKEHSRLVAACNDAAGLTAEFNRNILRVVNTKLGADFDPTAFEHRAFYNRTARRTEMHLVSTARQAVTIPGVGIIEIEEGETIRTDIGSKYDRHAIQDLLGDAGFQLAEWRTDDRGDYAVAVGE